MNKNLIFVFLIGTLILTIGLYHFSVSEDSVEWGSEEGLYPLNEVQKEWLKQKEELLIGVADDSVPFLDFDGFGKPAGLLRDYLDRIGNGYGVRLAYLPVKEEELEGLLKEGKLDAAVSTPDREGDEGLRFTMPIVKTKGVLLVKKGVGNAGDGQGLTILLTEGSLAESAAAEQFPKAKLLLCGSMKEVAERAEQGEGNAMAGSEPALVSLLGGETLDRDWVRASGYLYEGNLCLAIEKDNGTLYDILNNAVYHGDKERVISELQGKWTGISYPLYVENRLENLGILIIIIFTAVLSVFFLFYQSNKSLYEELQQRMELLVESQNEMQTTFDGVTYYLAELAWNGTVISINKALSQYLSIKRHKAAGLPLVSLLKLEEQERTKLSAIILETFRDEAEKNDEIAVGKKIFEVHTFLIKNNKEQIQKILVMMVDVTEARNTERQMLQNHKMIAVGQLAAGVAHEIRNPLGLIRNYCYVLKEIDDGDVVNRDEAIDVIEKSVEKSSRIIENLLNFSRLSTNKREFIDLRAHINSMIELQKSLLNRRKIDFFYEYTGEPTALINVEAMEIILVNLITNAADAIASSGIIRVCCGRQGQSVQLTVSDNGAGIPPELMDEIYNPFFSTKAKKEGSGLGLYLVYNEVQKLGGEIKAESEVGVGTRFYIKIPI